MDFGEFYKLNYKGVYRFFYYKGIPKAECEDLLQDAFIRIYQGYLAEIQFDHVRAGKILFGIAANMWKDWLSAQKKEPKVAFDEKLLDLELIAEYSLIEQLQQSGLDIQASDFEEKLKTKIAIVKSAMKKLRPKVRQVIELRFLKQKTRQQTAAELKMTEDQVHTYQKRGLKYLRNYLIVPLEET